MLLELALLETAAKSNLPRIATFLTPIKSRLLPHRIKIVECCWRLWPWPGILAIKLRFVLTSLILQTLLFAEFGFLGDIVKTFKQTALSWGKLPKLLYFFLDFLISFIIRFIYLISKLDSNQQLFRCKLNILPLNYSNIFNSVFK